MRKLSEKIVEASSRRLNENEPRIGPRLRELRKLAGLTQVELATRLGIGQTALSKLEKRSDVQVSTLRDYVEALGASLIIDAAFNTQTASALHIIDSFKERLVDENQLELPIFSNDDIEPPRDVVLSIKPQYSSLILNGRKTVELRRRFPTSVPKGTLAFIYSTTPDQAMVGTAQIKGVFKKPLADIWSEYSKKACIDKSDFDSYFRG